MPRVARSRCVGEMYPAQACCLLSLYYRESLPALSVALASRRDPVRVRTHTRCRAPTARPLPHLASPFSSIQAVFGRFGPLTDVGAWLAALAGSQQRTLSPCGTSPSSVQRLQLIAMTDLADTSSYRQMRRPPCAAAPADLRKGFGFVEFREERDARCVRSGAEKAHAGLRGVSDCG